MHTACDLLSFAQAFVSSKISFYVQEHLSLAEGSQKGKKESTNHIFFKSKAVSVIVILNENISTNANTVTLSFQQKLMKLCRFIQSI